MLVKSFDISYGCLRITRPTRQSHAYCALLCMKASADFVCVGVHSTTKRGCFTVLWRRFGGCSFPCLPPTIPYHAVRPIPPNEQIHDLWQLLGIMMSFHCTPNSYNSHLLKGAQFLCAELLHCAHAISTK